MRPINNRTFLLLSISILSAGLVWIWFSKVDPASSRSADLYAPHEGFLAPNFALADNDNQPHNLADFHGRPLVVNFWASWCIPCRAEMPALQRIYSEFRGQGLEILAVNAALQDEQNSALEFANRLGLTFPILFDQTGEVAQSYRVRSLPTTFFIDSQGVIQDVIIGGPLSEALLNIRVSQLLSADAQETR